MNEKKRQRYITAAFIAVMMIASVLAITPMAGADTGDVIDDFIGTGPYICPGYATSVWADVDEDGTYDTQVVFTTSTGEAYVDLDSYAPGKWYFFTGIDNHCGGAAPWDRGRFVIHFVDILAPGFVWDDPTTWTYKRISSLSVEAYHDGCVASGDWSTAYQSVQAYQNLLQTDPITGTSTPFGDWSWGYGWTLYEFSDSTGIMELYVSTDYCENLLDDLILRTATIIPPIPELCPDEYRWSAYNTPGYEWDPFPNLFRSWNDVHFVNCGSGDAFSVTATISYVPANVVIVDGDVTVGDIPASSGAWSSDFFELEVDMTNPQDPNEGIEWRVEYDDADGVHHMIENVPEFCAVG